MPVEFLTDEQAESYGTFTHEPTRPELERFLFLDDEDRRLIGKGRGDHSRLGFALQACTVRHIGPFLSDPLAVPSSVVEYLADQLGISDPSCVKRYTEREKTAYEHAWEIEQAFGYHAYETGTGAEGSARSCTAGRGRTPRGRWRSSTPAVAWLRRHRVLLPGVSVLAQKVSAARTAAWTGFLDAFTHVSEGALRMAGLPVSLVALLVAEACNIGLTPVINPNHVELTRTRLSHVDQNYLRGDTIAAANALLIEAQSRIPLARCWGGGHLASVDGVRFVVPARTINAAPSPKYYGFKREHHLAQRGQRPGLGDRGNGGAGNPARQPVHPGHLLNLDGGVKPEMVATDHASYSDMVFGLFKMLGYRFSPRLRGTWLTSGSGGRRCPVRNRVTTAP